MEIEMSNFKIDNEMYNYMITKGQDYLNYDHVYMIISPLGGFQTNSVSVQDLREYITNGINPTSITVSKALKTLLKIE